jgi:hypothetical protein
MFHAYVERFDVMGVRENILGWDGEVNKASYAGTDEIYVCAPSLASLMQIAKKRCIFAKL